MNASHHFAAIMDTAPPEARTVPAIVRAVGLVARVRLTVADGSRE